MCEDFHLTISSVNIPGGNPKILDSFRIYTWLDSSEIFHLFSNITAIFSSVPSQYYNPPYLKYLICRQYLFQISIRYVILIYSRFYYNLIYVLFLIFLIKNFSCLVFVTLRYQLSKLLQNGLTDFVEIFVKVQSVGLRIGHKLIPLH